MRTEIVDHRSCPKCDRVLDVSASRDGDIVHMQDVCSRTRQGCGYRGPVRQVAKQLFFEHLKRSHLKLVATA